MTLYANFTYAPNTSNVKLWISSNHDNLTSNATLYYPNWGIYDMFVSVLKCHANCKTCAGPLESDCLICEDVKRELKNGICKCNTTAGYYEQGTTCQTSCSANYYRDKMSTKCVLIGACTAPNRFGDMQNNCVQDCTWIDTTVTPNTLYYAQNSSLKCVSNCGDYLEYKYEGASRSCVKKCPSLWMAYPPTNKNNWQCVQKCPLGWYYQLENRDTTPICVDKCLTGWQDEDLNECVNTCPNGYFKQIEASSG